MKTNTNIPKLKKVKTNSKRNALNMLDIYDILLSEFDPLAALARCLGCFVVSQYITIAKIYSQMINMYVFTISNLYCSLQHMPPCSVVTELWWQTKLCHLLCIRIRSCDNIIYKISYTSIERTWNLHVAVLQKREYAPKTVNNESMAHQPMCNFSWLCNKHF